MNQEIIFDKYKKKGADYHYKQVNKLDFRNFNSYVFARYYKQINILEKLINKKNQEENQSIRILDVGCGDGVLINLMKKEIKTNIEYFGNDLSEDALNIAKEKNPQANFFKEIAYKFQFSDNFFDFIVSSDVIEHVKEPKRMLKEIKRVLKPGGIAVLGTPIKITEKPIDVMHCHEFFPEEFKKLCEEFFKKNKLVLSHSLFYFLLARRRINFLGGKINIFKYFMNLLSLIGYNVFMKKIKDDEDYYSYMFIICEK
jgi:ubiquinone/menaquinone biosynthesis C-methylase UbiE